MSYFAECKAKYMRSDRENTEKGGFIVAFLQGCLTMASGRSDSLLRSGSLLRNLHIIKVEPCTLTGDFNVALNFSNGYSGK